MNATNPDTDGHLREIELRAYYIWEREGRPAGRQHEHWAVAEAEFLSEQRPKQDEAPKNVTANTAAPAEKKNNGTVKPAKAAAPDEPIKAAAKSVKKTPLKPKRPTLPRA